MPRSRPISGGEGVAMDMRGHADKSLRASHGMLAALVAALASIGADALGATPARSEGGPAQRGPIYEFLIRSGVPIDSRVHLAKVSAVLRTRQTVRSVLKIVTPERLPGPAELEEIRKKVSRNVRRGSPIRLNTSRMPSELDLLRQNILSGEVIEFHPSEKLGELELFFSRTQSLKIEIGYDIFYIRIGNEDCTFRSDPLRKQLKNILERREVKQGERTEDRGGRSRPPREAAR